MSKDTNELLGHAEDNDGIDEYDNPLPDWWLGLFFFTIVFAVGYTIDYHALSQRSQTARYDAEMAAAAARWPQAEAPDALAFDTETLEAGRHIFATTCASCHGAELQGGIGPNLVDAEWIHGNAPDQVVNTIRNGVAAKGMPAWGPILGPDKVSQVASFILSRADGTAVH